MASVITLTGIGWNSSILKGGDQWGYNAYLVGTFINHDLTTLETTYTSKNKEYGIRTGTAERNSIDEAPAASNGNPVLKYYYGVAVMQAPFFIFTHLLFGGNGYSEPYVFAISFSCIFYVLLGCLLMFNLLKNFIKETIAAFSILLFFFGTNLFYFTLCNPGLSHPYLFFLFACLANCTYAFYKKPTYGKAAVLGMVGGLIVMTRAVEAIVLVIILLFAVQGLRHVRERAFFIRQHIGKFFLAAVLCLIVTLPQLFYWKASSGYWFYDTYPNEGFDFLKPHIIEGLFSFKNGWFAYTPLMLFSLLSLIAFRGSRNPFAFGITLYILLDIYITYSWKQWNYNAGLGSRPMVDAYALLLIPFSIGLSRLLNKRIKWIIFSFFAFSVYINVLRTVQMQTGNFISEDATGQFNKQMLFKLTTNLDDIYAFDLNQPQPDNSNLVFIKHIGKQDFETDTDNPKDTSLVYTGSKSGSFTKNEFNDPLEVRLDTSFEKCQFLRITVWARVASYENHYRMGKIVVDLQRNSNPIIWKSVRIHNKLSSPGQNASLFVGSIGQWKQMNYYVETSQLIKDGDVLKVYAWNPAGVQFWVDDIVVDGFRNK